MQISDDNLIAYLLGDASPELIESIEQQLAIDSGLVERLNYFRRILGHVDSLGGFHEPPSDLVESTLARIDAVESESTHTGGLTQSESHADEAALASALKIKLSPAVSSGSRRRSLMDSTVLALSLSLLCCLVLPAIVRARFEARKSQCADNLRRTGLGLIQFALNDPQQRFPFVSLNGRNGFAGVYAVHLQSAGIPITPAQVQCVSLSGLNERSDAISLNAIPTFADLEQIDLAQLAFWQEIIGGDYSYSLGVTENNQVVAPKCEGRAQFAILSDSPVFVDDQENFIAHDGRGSNILYEDGRVLFVAPVFDNGVDNPFRNQVGAHAVGLNPHDASLGPSHFRPLGD